jgi:hypothetical protein
MFRRALGAVETVRELIAAGAECDAIAPRHLQIAHRPSRAAALRAEAELVQREFGYAASFLDGDEVREHHIGGTQSYGARRVPDAVAVHPPRVLPPPA